MKIKTTKTMAKELQKALTADGFAVDQVQLSPAAFRFLVDLNEYKHESDYNITTGKFDVIRVVYPPEFHACTAYLTTADLIRCYRASDKTFDGFINSVCDAVRI